MKTCDSCKAKNLDKARYCRHCGMRFHDWIEEYKRSEDDQILISRLRKEIKSKSVFNSQLKKEKSRLKFISWTAFILLIILLPGSLYYCYRLEQPKYNGKKYLSEIIGQEDYFLIDGKLDNFKVSLNSSGDAIRYSVQTNLDSLLLYNLPDWITVSYNASVGDIYISASPNRLEYRSGHFAIGLPPDTIGVNVTQIAHAKQSLLINGKASINSSISHMGETVSYAVSSDTGECVVKSKPKWCSIQRNSDGILSILFKRNPEPIRRIGEIFLSAGEYKAVISVSQNAGENLKPINGNFSTITVEQNVYEDTAEGMRIHMTFSTQNMKNFEGEIAAYFCDSNGNQLRDTNGKYTTSDGHVAVSKNFVPSYESSTFNDFTLFMPYQELDLPQGEYNLKMYCILWDLSKSTRKLDESQFFQFEYRDRK